MAHNETSISMFLLHLLNVLTLIIICILIAQLCNDNEYGYKSLNSFDPEMTSRKFKYLINDNIYINRRNNYINLIFNFVIYFYYNIRINPEKHISKCAFLFFNIFFIILICIEIILNINIIGIFNGLSYENNYFYFCDITEDDFNKAKNYGKKNLKLQSTILSFNCFQLLILILVPIIMRNILPLNCPMGCEDFIELFLTSENYQNRENSDKINVEIIDEKRKSTTEINEIKNENEKLKNKIKNLEIENDKYKKKERILFLIKYYIFTKHETQISTESMLENFIKDINEKFKENIELNNMKEIAIMYIKEKLIENLTCPISQDIFVNPYIAPEGQTFDKIKIYQVIETKGLNPLTNSKIKINQLILNRKVLDLVEFYKDNKDNFNENACLILKEILKNNENKYYENPIVLSSGENMGNTVEGYSDNNNYKNLIVKSLIEQLREILDEYFQNDSNKKIKAKISKVIFQRQISENRNLEDEF